MDQKISQTYKSQNFDNRVNNVKIKYIILHYTETKTLKQAIKLLCSDVRRVSSHFVIDEFGNIFNLVDEDKRAWHAGESSWHKETRINDLSIGIEIVYEGEKLKRKYSDSQIDSLIILINYLKEKYKIKQSNILGHSDIAPLRKIDPGVFFPWERLFKNKIGIWPKELKKNKKKNRDLSNKEFILFLKNLEKIGFNIINFEADFNMNKFIINAFHRHYLVDHLDKKPSYFSYIVSQEIIKLTD